MPTGRLLRLPKIVMALLLLQQWLLLLQHLVQHLLPHPLLLKRLLPLK